MDRLSSIPSPDEQMRIDTNIFSQSAAGQRMLLRNIGCTPDFPQVENSLIDETMQINQNTKKTADYVRELQITVTGLRNDLNAANALIEQNRIDTDKTINDADRKNWRRTLWLALATTVGGAALGFVFTLLAVLYKYYN